MTFLLLFLQGCSSLNPSPQTFPALPERHELVDVPFFPQRQKQCGPASLATVLNYREREVSPLALEPLLYVPEKEGTLAIELVAQARQRGLLAYALSGKLADVLAEVAAGNPVLVMQNLGFSWLPQWHFAVVVGYDQPSQSMILRSGREPRHQMPMRLFVSTWERAHRWAVVVMPPAQVPASASPMRYLRAAANLESVQPEAAFEAYEAALEMWPQQPDAEALARLGLANIAYGKGDHEAASRWLLAGGGPVSVAHWNNLAYSLAARGCGEEALRALECGLQLRPQSAVLHSSREEIRQLAGEPRAERRCGLPPGCEFAP